MLSRIVAFSIQGICATYAIEDSIIQFFRFACASYRSPAVGALGTCSSPDSTSASPMIEANSKLLPEPVRPETTLNSFFGNVRLRLCKVNWFSSFSGSSEGQAVVAFLKDTVSPGLV